MMALNNAKRMLGAVITAASILIWVPDSLANPINGQSQCVTSCVPNTKFEFESGVTYRYSYSGETVTSLRSETGGTSRNSRLSFAATVDVFAESSCAMILSIRDVVIQESSHLSSEDEAAYSAIKQDLEKKSTRFAFQDGKIEAMCTARSDPPWVVNFKRGVLASLQNSMDSFSEDMTVIETDVSGVCETEYKTESVLSDNIVVSKQKNLKECTKRADILSSIRTESYTPMSDENLLQSSLTCQQTIRAGLIMRTECEESHMFSPFSEGAGGVESKIKQTLEFQNTLRIPAPSIGKTFRTDMTYDHTGRSRSDYRAIENEALTNLLKLACDTKPVDKVSSEDFTALVRILKQADTSTLLRLFGTLQTGSACQKEQEVFYDVITAVGTSASLNFIRETIASQEISDDVKRQWMTSLPFIQSPSESMIEDALALLEEDDTTQSYLPVSALVSNFCKKETECINNRDVQTILDTFVDNLGYNCKAKSEHDVNKMLISLKAIGNVGVDFYVSQYLGRCLKNKQTPVTIRLAAAEALSLLPCDTSRAVALDVTKETTEDVEVRLAAYLASMKCPTASTIDNILQTLEQEPVKQVASFILSHLNNLKETDDPFKLDIKNLLKGKQWRNKFDMDNERFSKNYEGSFNIGVESIYESNLIFSPSSFVPRAGMVNLTMNMLGQSVNIFQFGARTEGFESYLEHLFGPNTSPDKNTQDPLYPKLSDLRDNFKIPTEPRASAYIKIFGNELQYFDIGSPQWDDVSMLDILNSLAERREYNVRRSLLLVDSTVSIPTILGLPLQVSVDASAVLDLAVGGRLDLRKLSASPRSLDVNGYFKPSAAVTVNAKLGVALSTSETGLRFAGTLQTSTSVGAKLQIQEGQVLKASFDIPDDKLEFIKIEGDVLKIRHGKEERFYQDDKGEEAFKTCTSAASSKVTGLMICYGSRGDMPISMLLEVEKADSHSGYEFEARMETRRDISHNNLAIRDVARLKFNTPGSAVNREFIAEIILDRSNLNVDAQLKSPWKHLSGSASLINTAHQKKAELRMAMDGKNYVVVLADLAIEGNVRRTKYTADVRLSVPWIREITARGEMTHSPGRGIQAECSFPDLGAQALLRRTIQLNDGRYATDIEMTSPMLNLKLHSITVKRENLLSIRNGLTYAYNNQQQQEVNLRFKAKKEVNGESSRYEVDGILESSQFPYLTTGFVSLFSKSRQNIDVAISIDYDAASGSTSRKIEFMTSGRINGNFMALQLQQNMQLKWLPMNIDVGALVKYAHSLAAGSRFLDAQGSLSPFSGHNVTMGINLKEEYVNNDDGSTSYKLIYLAKYEPQDGNSHRYHGHYLNHNGLRKLLLDVTRADEKSALELSLRPVLSNLHAKAKLLHNKEEYMIGAAFNYAASVDKHLLTGIVNAEFPQLNATSKINLQLQPNTYVVLTEFHLNGRKHLLNAKLKFEESLELLFKIIYPGRKILLKSDTTFHRGKLQHTSQLSWERGEALTLSINGILLFDGNSVVFFPHVTLEAPYFQKVDVHLKVESKDDKIQSRLLAKYGDAYNVSLDADWSTDMTQVSTEASILTPHENYENTMFVAGYAVDKTGNNLDLSAHAQLLMAGNEKGVLISINTDTPISSNVEVRINNNGDAMNAHAQYSLSTGNRGENFEAEFSIESPFQAMREIKSSCSYVRNKKDIETEINFVYNKAKIISHQAKLRNENGDANLIIKSIITGESIVFVETSFKKNRFPYVATVQIGVNAKNSITLEVQVPHFNSSLGQANIRLTSPMKDLERILFSFQYTNDVNVKKIEAETEYGPGKRINFAASLYNSTPNQHALEFEINTPCPVFKHFKSHTEYASLLDFKSTAVFIQEAREDSSKLEHHTCMVRHLYDTETLLTQIRHQMYQVKPGERELETLIGRFKMLAEKLAVNRAPKNGMDRHISLRDAFPDRLILSGDSSMSDLIELSVKFDSGPADAKIPTIWASFQAKTNSDLLANIDANIYSNISSHGMDMGLSVKADEAQIAMAKVDICDTFENRSVDIVINTQYNGGYQVNLDVKGSQDYQGEKLTASLETPIAHLKHVIFEGRTNCTSALGKCDARMSLQYAPNQVIEISSHIIARRPLSGSLVITTPFHDFSRMAFEFEFVGSLLSFDSNFQLEIGLANGDKHIKGGTELLLNVYQREVKVVMNLETNFEGYEDIEITVSNRRLGAGRMRTRVVIVANNQQISVDNQAFFKDWSHFNDIFSLSGPTNIDIRINQNGDTQGFVHSFELEINDAKTAYSGVFQTTGPTSGTFVLQTPYDVLKEAQLIFTLEKNVMAFESRAEVTYFGDKKIFTENFIRFSRGFECQIILTSPYCEDFKAAVSHIGGYNFRHKSEVSYGKSEVLLSSEFALRPFKGFAKLETPFENVQSLEASVEAAITSTGFEGNFRASHNDLNFVEMSSLFSRTNSVKGQLQFGTNMPMVGHLNVNFTHEIAWPTSAVTVVIEYREKYFSLNTGFNTLPIDVFFELISPYEYSKIIEIRGGVDGNLKACECRANVNINKNKLDVLTKWNMTDTFEVGYKVLSDLAFVRRTFSSHGSFEYVCDSDRLHSSLECAVNNQEVTFSSDITRQPIYGRIDLNTPFQNVRRLLVAWNQNGDVNNFSEEEPFNHNLMGEIIYEGKLQPWTSFRPTRPAGRRDPDNASGDPGDIFKFQCTGDLGYEEVMDNGRRKSGSIPINMNVAFNNGHAEHDNERTRGTQEEGSISSIGLITVNEEPLLNVQLGIGFYDDSRGKFHLKTEYIDNLKVLLRHIRYMKELQLTTNLLKKDEQLLAGSMNYSVEPLKINVEIKRSSPDITVTSVHFDHEGKSSFETSFELKYGRGRIYTVEVSRKNNPLVLRGKISTTHPNRREIELYYRHASSNKEISYEGNILINKDLKHLFNFHRTEFQTNGKLQLTLQPFLQDFKTSFNHVGGIMEFTNFVETHYGSDMYRLSNEFELRPLRLQSVLVTPIAKYENIGFKVTQRGNLRRSYEGHLELTYKTDKTVIIDAEIKQLGRFLGSLAVSTPIGDVGARLRHQLEDSKMKSSMLFQYGTNSIDGELVVHLLSRPRGWFEIKTPFDGFRTVKGEFKYDISDIMVATFGTIDVDAKITAVRMYALYQGWEDMEGSFTIETPFEGAEYIEISAENHQQPSGVESAFKIILPEDVVLHGNMNYQATPLQIFFNSSCDVGQERKAEIILSHSGHLQNFKTNTSVNYGENSFENSVVFKNDFDSGLFVALEFETPYAYLQRIQSASALNTRFNTPQKIEIYVNENHEFLLMFNFPKSLAQLRFFDFDVMTKSPLIGGSYSLDMENTDTGTDIVIDVEIASRDNNNIAVLAAMETRRTLRKTSFDCQLWLRTPFEVCEKASVLVSYDKAGRLLNQLTTIEFNNKKLTVKTGVDDGRGNSFLQEAYLSINKNENEVEKELNNNRIGYKIYTKKQNIPCLWCLGYNEMELQLVSPVRVIESYLNGTLEETRLVLKWDGSRDNKRQISLAVREERSNKGHGYDVTISSPLLQHDITLRNDILVNSNGVLFMARHQLRYSNDLKKHVYLFCKIAMPQTANLHMTVEAQHLTSMIDVRLTAQTKADNDVHNASVDMHYLARDDKVKSWQFSSGLSQSAQSLDLTINTPLLESLINYRMDKTFQIPVVEMSLKHSDDIYMITGDILEASYKCTFLTSSANINAEIPFSNKEQGVKISYAYEIQKSKDDYKSLLISDEQPCDLGFTITKEYSGYVTSNIHWQENTLDDVRIIFKKIRDDVAGVGDVTKEIGDAFMEEYRSKYSNIVQQLPDAVTTGRLIDGEVTSFTRQFNKARKTFGRLYANDEFFLHTLHDWLDTSFTYFSPIFDSARTVGDNLFESANTMGDLLVSEFWTLWRRCGDRVLAAGALFVDMVSKTTHTVMADLRAACGHLYTMSAKQIQSASQCAAELAASLMSNPQIEKLRKAWEGISWSLPPELARDLGVIRAYGSAALSTVGDIVERGVDSLHNIAGLLPTKSITGVLQKAGLYRNLQNIYGTWNKNSVLSVYEDSARAYDTISRRINDRLVPRAKDLIGGDLPREPWNAPHLKAFARDVISEIKWTYLYLDDVVRSNHLLNVTIGNAGVIGEGLLELHTYNDTERGRVSRQLQLWLPSSVPDLRLERYLMSLVNESFHLLPSFGMPQWLSPLDSTAVISISSRHIVTFENKMIPFDDACWSLLAYDVIGESFTLTYNSSSKALELFTGGQRVEVIGASVTIDTTPVGLPYVSDTVTIALEDDDVVIKSTTGVSLQYDTKQDRYVFGVSGWLQGKVVGLLGTHTHEHFDDFTTSTGAITKDTAELVKSWNILGHCNKQPTDPPVNVREK